MNFANIAAPLDSDAIGLGAILSQVKNGKEQVIMYSSGTLKPKQDANILLQGRKC